MNNETLLLRQIHPTFLQNGRATSQAFRPTPKDESKLSVYDGGLIDPPTAWEHYTKSLALPSAGVMGVTVAECSVLGLQALSDPVPFLQHVTIDFSAYSKNQIEKKAKLLQVKAQTRGWLY